MESAESEGLINPFKDYVRRRGGRVGQRFHVSIVLVGAVSPLYDGQVMLMGWADSEKGKTVSLWLDEEADRHPFAGCEKRAAGKVGSLLIAAFVVLNDDEKPLSAPHERTEGGRKLSAQVHLMITSPRFCKFLEERSQKTATLTAQGLSWSSTYNGEMMSRSYVKSVLQVESLSDLDRDPAKAELFHKVFRRPFSRWNGDDPR